eukprot:COSAG02_NODE_22893_length_736_cov_1.601256_2_plen_63_part_01
MYQRAVRCTLCCLRATYRSVIDHAIPPGEVEIVLAECVEATGKIHEMRQKTGLARRLSVLPED